ncbi:hypothetical protein CH375_15000, partial [Leptospira ellisii]
MRKKRIHNRISSEKFRNGNETTASGRVEFYRIVFGKRIRSGSIYAQKPDSAGEFTVGNGAGSESEQREIREDKSILEYSIFRIYFGSSRIA